MTRIGGRVVTTGGCGWVEILDRVVIGGKFKISCRNYITCLLLLDLRARIRNLENSFQTKRFMTLFQGTARRIFVCFGDPSVNF